MVRTIINPGQYGKHNRYFIRFMLLFSCLLSGAVFAQSYQCPSNIAMLDGDPLSSLALQDIKLIYGELGCAVDFVPLPGRRGLKLFNEGAVDGELFRMHLIEAAYQQPFIRSSIPVVALENALWVRSDLTANADLPYGYILGIKWHEEFIAGPGHDDGRRYKKYSTEAESFADLAAGKLKGLLTDQQTITLFRQSARHDLVLEKEIDVGSSHLYHYLHADFSDFMQAFSTVLKGKQGLAN